MWKYKEERAFAMRLSTALAARTWQDFHMPKQAVLNINQIGRHNYDTAILTSDS